MTGRRCVHHRGRTSCSGAVVHPLSTAQLDRYAPASATRAPGTPASPRCGRCIAPTCSPSPTRISTSTSGLEVSLDPEAMFTKLVDERRGSWCFEMNGVFGRVLETLGFTVRYLSGAVGRAERGWRAQGNHLVLLVTLDRPWIADVGFGDGFLTPLPLEPGNYRQDFLQYQVTRDGPRWRVHNHQYGGADGFDFTLTPRRLDEFAQQCHELQTSPDSGFVRSTVCERMLPTGLIMLRGASLREVRAEGVTTAVVGSAGDYDRVLRERFDLAIPGIETLWPRVWARHLQWLAEADGPARPGSAT
ncbi:MAG: arylamine N-acetyltransferase [Vicinamibacterales bacterium]